MVVAIGEEGREHTGVVEAGCGGGVGWYEMSFVGRARGEEMGPAFPPPRSPSLLSPSFPPLHSPNLAHLPASSLKPLQPPSAQSGLALSSGSY